MPKLKKVKIPKLCNDRGRAYSRYKGARYYFGVYGTPEAEEAYKRFLREVVLRDATAPESTEGKSPANVGYTPPQNTGSVLIARLCAEFLKERRGKVSPTQWDNESSVVAVIVSLYGDMNTATFDINCLRAVRNEFIQKGYVRQKINWRVQIAQRVFRWGASYKIVPVSVHQELKTLIPLKKGEFGLPESKERQTVSEADIEKTKMELSPIFRAMVIVHLRVAGRPTEICELRIENIDRQSGDLWAVRLEHHKTDHLEDAETKVFFLAKPEIDVLLPLIGERTEGYIFRPIDALRYEKERRANGTIHVKKTPSRAARDAERAKNPKRQVGECYDFAAYRNAVYRACDRAGVARWFPYQLRHTGVTLIGLEHGVEAAQHTAGHRDIKTTLRYFHGENEIAKRVALSRNKSAMVEATVEEIKPVPSVAKSKSKDAVIAELLKQNQQLLETLLQKDDPTDLTDAEE